MCVRIKTRKTDTIDVRRVWRSITERVKKNNEKLCFMHEERGNRDYDEEFKK